MKNNKFDFNKSRDDSYTTQASSQISWNNNAINYQNGYLKRKSMKMDFQMYLLQMISHPKIMKRKIIMIPYH